MAQHLFPPPAREAQSLRNPAEQPHPRPPTCHTPEELLVFRITQKSWLLRRVETWERVIADSRVAKIREKHPNAAAPACIAMSLLEVKESNQTRFYERTAKLRNQHEDALDRLESKLCAAQQRREARTARIVEMPGKQHHLSGLIRARAVIDSKHVY